nr:casein kinase ii subunit alpha [Hymenolepis microstoma]
MGSSEARDIYKFRVKSSTRKDDCELHVVINVGSANRYVVKEFAADDCKEILKKERKILSCLNQCPFIVHLRCTIYNHKEYRGWLVYDFFTEPNWQSIIPTLSIDDIKSYAYQILSGIEFCHKQGIVHRNICWDTLYLDEQHKQLQIGGWQYGLFYDDVHPMENEVEIPNFKSPERLLGETSRNHQLKFYWPVDMWSIGCILGCMVLRKKYMFDGVDWRMILLNIEGVLGSKPMLEFVAKYDIKYNFVTLDGSDCSTGIDLKELITERNIKVATNEAIDLLANLIVIDPANRFTASEALHHDFFRTFKESSSHLQPQRDGSTIYKYKIENEAGFGSFSDVYRVIEVSKTESGKVCREFAAKRVNDLFSKFVRNEVKALELLRGCPNIIQLHGALESTQFKYACIFLEYFEGENLDIFHFETVNELQFYLYQLLLALEGCHNRGIMHRDVKPANVLVNYRTKQLRLIDFGLAEFYEIGRRYDCLPGALRYKAPELLLGYEFYDYAVDMWAFGVIFASSIFKRHIFDQSQSLISQITRVLGTSGLLDYIVKLGNGFEFYFQFASTDYPIVPWHSFINDDNRNLATENALDLIDKLLVYDYERRLKVEQAKEHLFFLPYSNI